MSDGKCGAPVGCSPSGGGDAVAAVAAIPLVVAGLAVVGTAKIAKAGYKFVKKTRAEAKKTASEVWLSEVMQKKPSIEVGTSSIQLFSTRVEGIKLDNVFNHLSSMNSVKNYNSGLYVTDYSFTDTNDRVVIVGITGTDKTIAFTKDDKGRYMALGNTSSERLMSKTVLDVINTFYVHDLHDRLSREWGFKEIETQQTPQIYKITAADQSNQVMTIEINKENGQVSFEGIPIRLRPKIEELLNLFTECRVTRTGEEEGVGTKDKTGRRIGT